MRIGVVGLGELGLPFAALASIRGHEVRGFDVDEGRMSSDWYCRRSFAEGPEVLARAKLAFTTLDEVVSGSEIVFVAVPTPSASGWDGASPVPAENGGYDLGCLRRALTDVGAAATGEVVVSVVSTVVPGTLDRLRAEIDLPAGVRLAHTPAFSAVGSMIEDLQSPEFVLIGAEDEESAAALERFFASLSGAPAVVTTVANAELVKLAYNAFITLKLGFANSLLELAHRVPGCDVDAVTDCLSLADRRLFSASYTRGGLGDGGGCHLKDGLALSTLARELGLSYDLAGENLAAREAQTGWLAELVAAEARERGLPVWILGTAYKPGVPLETASPALLLARLLRERGIDPGLWDPRVPGRATPPPLEPCVFVVATCHSETEALEFAPGSLVVDPWGHLEPRQGVELLRVGREPRRVGPSPGAPPATRDGDDR
ncbi:MAG: hypothetical protein R3190_01500 [Thermoanaerobaculia bacterium]|nr:hypothetical protein [Thermoanaerobaculia bacterium]